MALKFGLSDIKLISDIGKTIAEIYSLHVTNTRQSTRIAELEKELAAERARKKNGD